MLVGRRFGANESGNVHHGASSAPFRVDPRPTSAGAEAIPILAHAHLTDRILHAFFAVYNELGPGFLESVYETAMAIVMRAEGLTVECQAPAAVYFRGQLAGEFRADLLVERLVVVELEAGRALESRHEAQLLDYLRATDVDVGLLLNFGPRPAFRRLVYSRARGTVEVRASAGTPSQSPRSASVCDEPAQRVGEGSDPNALGGPAVVSSVHHRTALAALLLDSASTIRPDGPPSRPRRLA